VTNRLLLDVSSLMYRAFFALRDGLYAPDGRPVGALHGYLDMVARLVAARRPDEVVHVYDHEWRPVSRTDLYPAYKGNRLPDPVDLPNQFTLLREVLSPTGTLQAQTEGWEAEDAIGAFCVEARDDDRIQIVSGDRDLIQLVRDPVVKLLFTVRGVTELLEYDEATVLERYGVSASRYGDFAILRGDPSDGLPGVKGVGEKTAKMLIETFGSLDGVVAAALAGDEPMKPRVREAIAASAGYLATMQRLVPVNADAPLSVWAGERDDEACGALATTLAIKGPMQRLLAALDGAGAR